MNTLVNFESALLRLHGQFSVGVNTAGVQHLVFMSVADAEFFDEHVKHLHAKVALEKYLRESGVPFSILRPCAFFENLDDAANWNPLDVPPFSVAQGFGVRGQI